MLDRPIQFLLGPTLDRQPALLHQEPHRRDAAELRAVGWQKHERNSALLQQCERRSNGCCAVDAGIVEHDHQRLSDLLRQVGHEAQEELGGAGAPVLRVFDFPAAEQRGYHVEVLAAQGIDQVLLAARRLGAAVGMHLSETGFVEVGQLDLAGLRLCPQSLEFFSGLLESGGVPLFFKL